MPQVIYPTPREVGVFTITPMTNVPADWLSSRKVRGKILATLQKQARKVELLLNNLVSTWQHKNQIVIGIESISYAGGNIAIEVVVDDPIFFYLDEGTVVRWALMSSNFSPKTTPDSLIPRSGRGGTRLRGQKAFKKYYSAFPKPGIAPRGFTKVLEKMVDAEIDALVQDMLSDMS